MSPRPLTFTGQKNEKEPYRAARRNRDRMKATRVQSSGSQKCFKKRAKAPSTEAETVTQSRPQEASLSWIRISSGCKDRRRRQRIGKSLRKFCCDAEPVGWKLAGEMRSREFLFMYSHDGRRNSTYNDC